MTCKLQIPYVSQEDLGAKAFANDCGPTCLKMLLGWAGLAEKVSVDQISRDIKIAPRGKGSFAGFNQLMFAASKYGLKLVYQRPTSLDKLRAELDAGRPSIALIHYGSISRRQSTFNGGHFVIVSGYDDDLIFLHDPDWWGDRRDEGIYLPVPADEFETAYGPVGAKKAGNIPYQALLVKVG